MRSYRRNREGGRKERRNELIPKLFVKYFKWTMP
jgi:hypothetical protein